MNTKHQNKVACFFPVLVFLVLVPAIASLAGCVSPSSSSSDDAADVVSAKASLAIGYASGDSASSVTKSITLPSSAGNGVNVSWLSGNPAIISATGVVTRPTAGAGDCQVTLVATLTKGSATDKKNFILTVKAQSSGGMSFTVDHDWTNLGSASAVSVSALAVSGSHIYAGSNAGVYYSDDGGTTWALVTPTDGLADNNVYSLAVSGSTVCIGTFQGLTVWDRSGSGTFTSYLPSASINDIRISDGTIYLAANSVSGSTDNGVQWSSLATLSLTKVATSFPYPEHLWIDGTTLYAAGKSSSTAIEEINAFSPLSLASRVAKDGYPDGSTNFSGPIYAKGSVIVFGVNTALYRSIDGGASFAADLSSGGGAVSCFASDSSLLYMAKYGSPLWYSSDSGATWKSADIPGYTSGFGVVANAVCLDGGEIYIAHSGGIVAGKLQ